MSVTLEYESVVQCTPEKIWERFSDVSSWKRFNPAISNTRWTSGEPWHPGSRLAMDLVQPRPMTIESEIVECRPPNFMRLKGRMMGVSADHTFEFTPQGDGGTRMRTAQVLTGAATIFISEKLRRAATETFANWFEAIRREVETC